MDSAYVEMAVSNCSSDISQCNNFSVVTSYDTSSPMMHALEPKLNVTNTTMEPECGKEMPPPSTVPGVSPLFSTVELSGFSQASCDINETLAYGSPSSKNAVSNACNTSTQQSASAENQSQVHLVAAPSQVSSQAIFHHQPEGSVQFYQTHPLEQRPGSVSASPGPPGSCGSGGSPAPSTSLSHPSVGSPWSFDTSGQNYETPVVTSLTVSSSSALTPVALQPLEGQKSEKPMPPKKPLTPYMRFSKSIWQQVKAANPSMSVCEVGATIGRMWREMIDTEKQRHNDDFATDKVRYDGELQSYLKVTGLQASDLVKPKAKKKEVKDKPQTPSRPAKLPAPQYSTTESMNCNTSAANDSHNTDPTATGVVTVGSFNGNAADSTLQASFQTSGVGQDGAGLGGTLGTLPHFSQVWSGQEVYSNPQILAQMGVATGQTLYAGQTMSEPLNASGMITIQPQDVNQADGQMAALYSQNQSASSQVGNQCLPAHQNVQIRQMTVGGMSESMTSTLNQSDNATALASNDNAWLWQQYNAGNQFVHQEALTQSTGQQAQSHEGVIIYQLTPDGTQNTLIRSSMESGIQPGHSIPMTLIAKQSVASDGTMEAAVLEPGEVPLSGQLQGATNGPMDAGLYDLNQLYGLTQWNQVKEEKMEFAQPIDGEKQLLRSALLEKTKEINRLTKELEQAYGLIHQLKQQNDIYQRHWSSQQQHQQQQHQLLVSPKTGSDTDIGTGISISS